MIVNYGGRNFAQLAGGIGDKHHLFSPAPAVVSSRLGRRQKRAGGPWLNRFYAPAPGKKQRICVVPSAPM
jgi:hypothetical protein